MNLITEMGPIDHMNACNEDTKYSVREYGYLTDTRVYETNGVSGFYLKHPEKKTLIPISSDVANVLTGDAMVWDMLGTKLEYRNWESKLDLIKGNTFYQRLFNMVDFE